MYFLFASITSMNSSTVRLSWPMITSQLCHFYSAKIDLMMSSGRFGLLNDPRIIPIPPFAFLRIRSSGGFLFSRIPNPSNSCSIFFLSVRGFNASKTINIKLQVRATPITCLPRPFPSLAPSMIPGKSRSWMVVPFYSYSPGMHVRVVNS